VYRVPVRDTDELGQRLVAIWAEFQQSMVYDTIDQWQKRLEACIYVEGGCATGRLRPATPVHYYVLLQNANAIYRMSPELCCVDETNKN